MTEYAGIEAILGSGHPYLSEVQRITNLVLPLPFECFYEPVSVFEHVGKARRLLALTPEAVNGWVRHVCYSSRVRMLNLEQGALSELNNGRLLTAMVLVRSHMEAAGMACLCHQELRRWKDTNDSSAIRELIPKTFFGTSMVRAGKKAESLEGMPSLSERDKIPIGRLIAAFDDFLSCGGPSGHAHAQYGILCEYTHPNMRAVLDHMETHEHETEETGIEGWFHKYRLFPQWSKDHYMMALHALMTSMKTGHAATEMLRRTHVRSENGKGYLQFPTDEDAKDIWEAFLNQPQEMA